MVKKQTAVLVVAGVVGNPLEALVPDHLVIITKISHGINVQVHIVTLPNMNINALVLIGMERHITVIADLDGRKAH